MLIPFFFITLINIYKRIYRAKPKWDCQIEAMLNIYQAPNEWSEFKNHKSPQEHKHSKLSSAFVEVRKNAASLTMDYKVLPISDSDLDNKVVDVSYNMNQYLCNFFFYIRATDGLSCMWYSEIYECIKINKICQRDKMI